MAVFFILNLLLFRSLRILNILRLLNISTEYYLLPKKRNVLSFAMQQKNEEIWSNVRDFCFNTLKKRSQANQCRFKDFQPFLNYSFWHLFELTVENLIRCCKRSLHSEDEFMSGFDVSPHGALLEDPVVKKLCNIKAVYSDEDSKKKIHLVKTLKKDENRPLHEFVVHKRTYSNLSKERS